MECFFSSEIDKNTFTFIVLNLLLIIFLSLAFNFIDGLPYRSLTTEISLKFKPFLNPEPKAFEKASFAANLFEK